MSQLAQGEQSGKEKGWMAIEEVEKELGINMFKPKISPKAKNDLAEIKDYISQELCNQPAAVNMVSKITKKIRMLEQHPDVGAPLSSVVDVQTDYRFLVCGYYLIFYRYEAENVFVSRILYRKRDYVRILFSDLLEENK